MLQKIRAIFWANDKNEGPPDLDEVWRELTDKFKAAFGGKTRSRPSGSHGSGNGGNHRFGNDSSGGGFPRLLGVLIAVGVIFWLASGFYIVDESQRGIVTRFGAFSEETQPGLQWCLPYPIERHEIVNLTGIRTVEIGYRGTEANKNDKESLMVTDDENIVNIQFAIQFYLKNAKDFVFNNNSANDEKTRGEDWVRQVAETAIREVVGRSKMDYVLYEGREEIATETSQLMQQILDRYQTGIQISRVTMQNAQPPEKVQAAFSDAVKAGQDLERQKNEGQAYFNKVVPSAKGEAARLLAEADAYKSQVVSVAQGDTARFNQLLAEYNRAPEVTRQRIYIDTMQEVMQQVAKVIVDNKSGNQMIYLPIDKMTGRPIVPEALGSQPASQIVSPQAGQPASQVAEASASNNDIRPSRGARP